jgi:tetraacyldisaccharide 4'-kinase
VAFSDRLVAAWYAPGLTPLSAALLPLSVLVAATIALRGWAYRHGLLPSASLPIPVVVVGSIVIGGVGKTPLVRSLCAALVQLGRRPGIVSRGYGGRNRAPRAVNPGDNPALVGDEPLLIAADALPVWIGRDRVAAARALLAAHPDCDVIVADDGLQHYALRRDFEIAVIDEARGIGNGWLIPAGPLREPPSRLARVDARVRLTTGGLPESPRDATGRDSVMTHEPLPWRNLVRPDAVADPNAWRGGIVHAVAGIGNPQRFFDLLRRLGLDPVCHPFPDHHHFQRAEIEFPDATAILMTEKDAVKCAAFADGRCWYLPIRARIEPALIARLEGAIRGRQVA